VSAISYQPSGGAMRFAQPNGRLGAVNDRRPGAATSLLLSQIAYQPFGPVASWVEGSGTSHSRTFDQDGRIVGIATGTTASTGTTSLSYDITGIAAGASSNGINVAAVVPHTIGYDALDRVTSYTSGPTTQTYTYDAAGNRTAYAAPNVALTYSYAASSNRLTGISGSSTESFTYDASGNVLTHNAPGADYTYTYNARNRRTKTQLGAIATTDTINGAGQRTVQVQGSTELFVYDEADHLIGSYNGTGVAITETVWLGDLPVVMVQPTGSYYIAPDHLGAPHEIADAGGNVGWRWDHDAFGNGLPAGTFSYDLRFPGQFYDPNAKLHYNHFRDFDPNTGRYIESDPIGLVGGLDTYAYAGGSPVGGVDPSGLEPWWITVGNEVGYRFLPGYLNDQIQSAAGRRGQATDMIHSLQQQNAKCKSAKTRDKNNAEIAKWKQQYNDARAELDRLLVEQAALKLGSKATLVGDPLGLSQQIITDADKNKVLETGPQSVNNATNDLVQSVMNKTQLR
jgi:RHS repeat-associated protein